MEEGGCMLSLTGEGRGEGVFAIRTFEVGETVVVGRIERWLSANHSHATQVGRSEYVKLGGLASKVNHSCDPNCGVRINGSGAPDLVARRTIPPGEEVTFDYAMRNYSIDHFPARCLCGAAGCRGTITGWRDLPEARKMDYRGLVAPYLLEIDREPAPAPARPGRRRGARRAIRAAFRTAGWRHRRIRERAKE
jgi:hypothetical protein